MAALDAIKALFAAPAAPLVPEDLLDAAPVPSAAAARSPRSPRSAPCGALRTRVQAALAGGADASASADVPTPLTQLEGACDAMIRGLSDAEPHPLLMRALGDLQSGSGMRARAATELLVGFCQERLLRRPDALARGVSAAGAPPAADAAEMRLRKQRTYDFQIQLRLALGAVDAAHARPTGAGRAGRAIPAASLADEAYRELKKLCARPNPVPRSRPRPRIVDPPPATGCSSSG